MEKIMTNKQLQAELAYARRQFTESVYRAAALTNIIKLRGNEYNSYEINKINNILRAADKIPCLPKVREFLQGVSDLEDWLNEPE
jgi:hypothetical protein